MIPRNPRRLVLLWLCLLASVTALAMLLADWHAAVAVAVVAVANTISLMLALTDQRQP